MSRYILMIRSVAIVVLSLLPAFARASIGLMEIESTKIEGPVTVFYPSNSELKRVERGPFVFDLALRGTPVRGNGRLIVISHGSPGSPWVHADLAMTLVNAGFIVAMPEHYRDNSKDPSEPGPESWKRRPVEVSRAIDVITEDLRFAPLLTLNKVGMFGMSAGGHTALTLAGGRWSPGRLKRHCEAFIGEDFHACVGLATRLNGGIFDGLKKRIAQWVISRKLEDDTWYTHTDPRIAAIVAGVPFAADFDATAFASLPIPLGIVAARQDKWLIPQFHSDRILQACPMCERISDLPDGGHGALLSPLPPGRSGLIADLINDPPGFDRTRVVPEINRKITMFFLRHLINDTIEISTNVTTQQTSASGLRRSEVTTNVKH